MKIVDRQSANVDRRDDRLTIADRRFLKE